MTNDKFLSQFQVDDLKEMLRDLKETIPKKVTKPILVALIIATGWSQKSLDGDNIEDGDELPDDAEDPDDDDRDDDDEEVEPVAH